MTQSPSPSAAQRSHPSQPGGLRRLWRDNALSIVVFVLFLLFWVGQSVVGWKTYNEDQVEHGQKPAAYATYLGTSHFWEATTENWESEFLQMGFFVVLTVHLRQRGSAESNKYPDEEQKTGEVESGPNGKAVGKPSSPLYRNSLSLALLGLFLASFVFHVISGAREYNEQQLGHGGEPVSALEFLGTSELWFQSLQNWQSEFLAIGAMVVLTVFLRQEGSSQSKSVDAPNGQTGND